jgi:hypothetical protein
MPLRHDHQTLPLGKNRVNRLRICQEIGILCVAMVVAITTTQAESRLDPSEDSAKARFFEQKVLPVLKAHCFKCHGPEKHENGLRLDSRVAMLAGGDSGPVIVPGDPGSSLLVDAVNYGDGFQMPPAGKLKDEQVDVLTDWITDGAVWPKPSK